MKTLVSLSIVLAWTAVAAAQEQAGPTNNLRRDNGPSMSRSAVSATPEMWFYQQERERYEDPKAAVRRNAEFRGAQRQHRLEAMKWFGYSNIRPTANPTPFTGTYSPMWISNSYDPSQWTGSRQPTVVLRSGTGLY